MIRTLGAILLLAAAAVVAAPVSASLYQPDEPMTVPVRPDGVGDPLPFDEFRMRMATLGNITDPRPTADGKPNRDRAKVLARVEAMRRSKLSPDEAAALAAEYLRLGNTDPREGDPGLFLNKALDLLAPHTRDRAPSYFVFTTLAEVYAARGELSDLRQAVDLHDAALIDTQMPPTVKGWTESQRNWIEKLDREYVPHYLRLRLADREQATRRSPETEVPTALFPLPSKGQTSIPLRFVNDAGSYEPGSLAKTELDKLPRDALAIAQQLVFWFPGDTRLLWMVAELYAAEGKLDEAETFFNEIAGSRQFGNRKIFMEHRRMVSEAIETRRKAAEQAAADAMPISLRAIWIYFGAVVLIAAVALLRVFTKRGKGSAWPGCCG